MALLCLFILTAVWIVGREALSISDCGAYARRPGKTAGAKQTCWGLGRRARHLWTLYWLLGELITCLEEFKMCLSMSSPSEYTDIAVVCGTSTIDLALQICPVIYTGYNGSLLILNHIRDNPHCHGTLDASAAPPVVRFSFPIREGNACGSNFLVCVVAVSGGGSEHVGCNRISAVHLCRPPAHRGREYSPTSPTSSQSTSAGWSGHMTPPWAPSPTTQSSCTSTRVLTPWSISSTTPSWTCKCEWRHMTSAGLLSATASLPPLRSSSSIAVTDKNGSFISTLSMSLYQVPASSRARRYPAAWFTCNSCRPSFSPGYILHQAPRHATAGHRTENKCLRPGGRIQPDVPVRTIISILDLDLQTSNYWCFVYFSRNLQ